MFTTRAISFTLELLLNYISIMFILYSGMVVIMQLTHTYTSQDM